jgi:hypothetical protein
MILLWYVSISQIDTSVHRSRLMQPKIIISLVLVGFYTVITGQLLSPVGANSVPLDRDIPEEVLRAEIIIEARSPIDGKALSANDFAELVVKTKQQLDLEDAILATSNPKFKETILLLRLRSFLKSVGIPIK